jgi:hypothetical protein
MMTQTLTAASKSVALDYDNTLVVAIELSNVSWVLAAQVPGLPRLKAKRSVEQTAEALMAAINGYRNRAREAGRMVERVLKAQCCPNALARKVPRDLHEDARDVARAHAATPEYVEACRRRKKVEMLFAHLKRILRLTRLRLRGPNGARDEFCLPLPLKT